MIWDEEKWGFSQRSFEDSILFKPDIINYIILELSLTLESNFLKRPGELGRDILQTLICIP